MIACSFIVVCDPLLCYRPPPLCMYAFCTASNKTEFRSNADEALKLTVRQDVTRKAGLKKLGRSVLVFDFQPAGAITATNSPNNVMDAPAHESSRGAREAGPGEGEEGSGESTGVTSASSVRVVFVHDRVIKVITHLDYFVHMCVRYILKAAA